MDKYRTIRGRRQGAGLLSGYSISKAWVDTGMKETPEEMIDFLMSFITKL